MPRLLLRLLPASMPDHFTPLGDGCPLDDTLKDCWHVKRDDEDHDRNAGNRQGRDERGLSLTGADASPSRTSEPILAIMTSAISFMPTEKA